MNVDIQTLKSFMRQLPYTVLITIKDYKVRNKRHDHIDIYEYVYSGSFFHDHTTEGGGFWKTVINEPAIMYYEMTGVLSNIVLYALENEEFISNYDKTTRRYEY